MKMVIFHSYVKLPEGIVIGAKTASHPGLLLLRYSNQRLVLAAGENMKKNKCDNTVMYKYVPQV